MNNLTFHTISLLMVGSGLTMAMLGLGIAVIIPGIDRWSRRFFSAFFMILLLYSCSVLAEEIIYIFPNPNSTPALVYYFETLLASLLFPLMTFYLLRCCGENLRQSTLSRAVTVLWTVSFIILSISPFTTWFYTVTADNHYHRGSLYPLMLLPLAAIQVLNLAGVFRRKSRLSKRYFYAFLIGLIPITIGIFVLFFVQDFTIFGIGLTTCVLSMFAIILSDQIEQNLRQQREIAHQRASIMVLQMRPHFIYNTMMSIYYLCKQNPDLAQQVTLDFTTYLRKNFTAIASEELIPFSEELEHTRAYLAVEQAQFEGSLFVDYDTPHIDFFVPPLTLQPIVENAVKHGMDPDSEPLHILIRTTSTDPGSEIIVENNGADFEPADDSEPHIALKNIQQRLEMMCRGKLTITPRNGGGTIVKVTIP